MKCNICGTENEENARYCTNCGASLDTVEAQASYDNQYYTEPKSTKYSSFATASMVLGIIAVVCSTVCCCLYFISLVLGPLSIIFAAIALKHGEKGKSTAGLVLGIIATVLAIVFLVWTLSASTTDFIIEYVHQACDANPDSSECTAAVDVIKDQCNGIISDECNALREEFPQFFGNE